MSVTEYAANFTEKMKLVPHLIPTELSKVNKFALGLPPVFGPMVKQNTTFKAAIWAAKNVETQIREKGLERAEVGEKRKHEGSSKSNKERKFSKTEEVGGGETMWCEKCKKKHFGKCGEEVTCYKCGKTGHYASKCASNKKVCYGCNKEGHISRDCPKKNEAARPNTPPRPRAFHMILDEAENHARNQG